MCVPGTRSQASALYLLCYFLGSRIGGSAGCLAYSDAGWPGLVAMVSGLLVRALIPAARLTLPSRTAGKDAGYTVVVPTPISSSESTSVSCHRTSGYFSKKWPFGICAALLRLLHWLH